MVQSASGETFTLEITQELKDQEPWGQYYLFVIQEDKNKMCEVIVGDGKIVSANGKPINPETIMTYQLDSIGDKEVQTSDFAPGTVLEIEALIPRLIAGHDLDELFYWNICPLWKYLCFWKRKAGRNI